MEWRCYSTRLHVRDERLPLLKRWQQQVEHVIRLLTVLRNKRQADSVLRRPIGELFTIRVTNQLASRLNGFERFQLRQQESGKKFGRQVAGADIYPPILVHLAP